MTQPIPQGYKQTEIGVIPEDWEVLHLGYVVATLESGVSVNSVDNLENFSHGYHVLKTSCVSNGSFIASEAKSILPKDVKRAKCLIRKGSIIVSRMNTPSLVGEIGFVPANFSNLFLPDRLWQLRLSTEKSTNAEWLTYLLSYPVYAKKIKESATGTSGSMKNISKLSFLSLNIPYPKLEEQTAIATALSDVDALISGLELLIAKKQAIKTATMQQLLTGKTRLLQFAHHPDGTAKGYKQTELGLVPEDWGVTSVFEIAENKKELFDDGDWIEAEHITDNGVRLIQTGNIGIGYFLDKEVKKYIYESSFEKLKCKRLIEGDLLICRLAEPAGRACIFPNINEEKTITSVDVTIYRPSSEIVDRNFLVQFFSLPQWFRSVLEQVGGTTHKRIARGALGKIFVPFPSLEEQTAIAQILSDMDSDIQALEARLSKTKQIKQGMMQVLLTGKVRLV